MQQHGGPATQSEILVQLPGVDDPARVKELIGTAAASKIVEVKDEAVRRRRKKLSRAQGRHPARSNTKLREVHDLAARRRRHGILSRESPVVTGRDMRNAKPRQDRIRQVGNGFHSRPGRRQPLRPLHRGQYRQPPGGRAGQPDRQRRHHPERDQDSGRITGLGQQEEARDLARSSAPARCRRASSTTKSRRSDPRSAPIRSVTVSGRSGGFGGGDRRDAGLLQARRA